MYQVIQGRDTTLAFYRDYCPNRWLVTKSADAAPIVSTTSHKRAIEAAQAWNRSAVRNGI